MNDQPLSTRLGPVAEIMAPLWAFLGFSEWARRRGDAGICDFIGGDPQEPPLPGLVEALRRWSVPRRNDWFNYRGNDPDATAEAARVLRERRQQPFEPADVFMTTGAFGGVALTLRTVVDPGDDVLLFSPAWQFYAPLIAFADATPVPIALRPPRFDLDVDAVRAALSPRTRAVIVNTPHNPSGRVYPADALRALADVLREASMRFGRAIYLISDEAYSRVIFDGRAHVSPLEYYERSFLIYTFTKTLLAPGQRFGYLALSPSMPYREQLRTAITLVQTASGYAYPDVVMQYALKDLERLSIDVPYFQRKRDRLVSALRSLGYELEVPEATFCLLLRSPIADDAAFAEMLAQRDVFVFPASLIGLPGFLRLSLTASAEMIERSVPAFAAVLADVRGGIAATSRAADPRPSDPPALHR